MEYSEYTKYRVYSLMSLYITIASKKIQFLHPKPNGRLMDVLDQGDLRRVGKAVVARDLLM